MVHVATAAAEEVGVDAEIIDVRSISPLDIDTLANSVNKTGRCLVAHEATRFAGYGAELAARDSEGLLLQSGSAYRTHCRLGYTLPARI